MSAGIGITIRNADGTLVTNVSSFIPPIPHDISIDRSSGEEIFKSRGIGSDFLPCCFVCGTNDGRSREDWDEFSNIAAFVKTKESGQNIVKMFDDKAWLDWRSYEPNWIQVKVGACDKHYKNLELLDGLSRKKNTITREIIETCKRF